MERLKPFIGEWSIEASLDPGARARSTFEWALDGRFLIQRSDVDIPHTPDVLCVVQALEDGTFTQHYFDSRDVVRLYAMTFDGRLWTLERTLPDFSPLDFWQRFSGTFSEAGDEIDGRWEISHDEGATWALDFELVYRRA